MTKDHILQEIRRTARLNGGRALGIKQFEQATGIRVPDWFGKYWKNWGDAVTEAGLTRNTLQPRIADDDVLASYAALVREIGRIPVKGDLRLKRRADKGFPNDKIFERFGTKAELTARARDFCRANPEFADVGEILSELSGLSAEAADSEATSYTRSIGFVYLIRSGKYYKIGRTNSVGRREYELGIQLPESVTTIHQIETDDPEGIELYWHRRFDGKRARGEWFKLDAADIAAFKRRRFQ